MRRRLPRAAVLVALASLTAAGRAAAAEPQAAATMVGPAAWDSYFPFRLGDSWTYDWKAEGPMAPRGVAVRTRTLDGTSFVNDTVGYKLVGDDGAYHLYTFQAGVLAIHSSFEAGRLLSYDPPVILAARDLRVGEPRVVEHSDSGRRWATTVTGVETVRVPLGEFPRALVVRLDMRGPDFVSSATHYFAARVGLVAYRYTLDSASDGRRLLSVDAGLRLARLAGVDVTAAADVDRLATASERPAVLDDRSLRDALRRALERRYTWDRRFPGLHGDVELAEDGKAPVRGSFAIGPDLSVRIAAPTEEAMAALRNEISSFITQRKPASFDLTYAGTTFVRTATRPDGAVAVTAVGDPLATTYTLKDDRIVEVGRSLGRMSYVARDRSTLRTDQGRLITVDYDVVYTSTVNQAPISVEHTRDTYVKMGAYWVPTGRRVETSAPDQAATGRKVRLTNLQLP